MRFLLGSVYNPKLTSGPTKRTSTAKIGTVVANKRPKQDAGAEDTIPSPRPNENTAISHSFQATTSQFTTRKLSGVS